MLTCIRCSTKQISRNRYVNENVTVKDHGDVDEDDYGGGGDKPLVKTLTAQVHLSTYAMLSVDANSLSLR